LSSSHGIKILDIFRAKSPCFLVLFTPRKHKEVNFGSFGLHWVKTVKKGFLQKHFLLEFYKPAVEQGFSPELMLKRL
jgi:hypothetical protein